MSKFVTSVLYKLYSLMTTADTLDFRLLTRLFCTWVFIIQSQSQSRLPPTYRAMTR